ncbi:MAG: tryptophan-rich sensory protein [Candidatus Moranbacteria bacterium]|nr:tryptophan-rich sensory protein [Candidatus Moranbacteria bacterium]
MKYYRDLFLWVLFSLSAGFLGSFATVTGPGSWYSLIEKPLWNPPSWVFGPVWTTLFVLIGAASFLVWRQHDRSHLVFVGLGVFFFQFVLNILWSYLFFAFQNLFVAFVEIVILWLMIVLMIVLFFRVRTLAGWFLVPYLFWVTFVAFLNFTIWQLN